MKKLGFTKDLQFVEFQGILQAYIYTFLRSSLTKNRYGDDDALIFECSRYEIRIPRVILYKIRLKTKFKNEKVSKMTKKTQVFL